MFEDQLANVVMRDLSVEFLHVLIIVARCLLPLASGGLASVSLLLASVQYGETSQEWADPLFAVSALVGLAFRWKFLHIADVFPFINPIDHDYDVFVASRLPRICSLLWFVTLFALLASVAAWVWRVLPPRAEGLSVSLKHRSFAFSVCHSLLALLALFMLPRSADSQTAVLVQIEIALLAACALLEAVARVLRTKRLSFESAVPILFLAALSSILAWRRFDLLRTRYSSTWLRHLPPL